MKTVNDFLSEFRTLEPDYHAGTPNVVSEETRGSIGVIGDNARYDLYLHSVEVVVGGAERMHEIQQSILGIVLPCLRKISKIAIPHEVSDSSQNLLLPGLGNEIHSKVALYTDYFIRREHGPNIVQMDTGSEMLFVDGTMELPDDLVRQITPLFAEGQKVFEKIRTAASEALAITS